MSHRSSNLAKTTFLSAQLFFCFALFSETIDFEWAYQSVVENACELKEADAAVAAGESVKRQAGAIPNPLLSVGMDNWGAVSNCNDDEEFFVAITQLIELGGKRSARINLADSERCVVALNREVIKCELFGQTLDAFIDMAVAQECLKLCRSQYDVAEQALSCIKAKTDSGKASSLEMKKAAFTCQSVKLLAFKQESALAKAKKELSSLWDCSAPNFNTVNFPLFNISPPPCLEDLYDALERNPEIAIAEADINRAEKVIRLERSVSIPDVGVQVGVSSERFNNKPSVGFQIDIPIPIFNQNQGNISRAKHERDQAIYNQMNIRCHQRGELVVLHGEWDNAYKQAVMLRDSVLPMANEWYQLAKQVYEEGKAEYLSVLDARNALFDIQQQYLDALEDYHHKRADVLKLTWCMPTIEN